jgi:hypothetical protein
MDESDCIKNKRIIDISTNFRNFNIKEINRKIADYFIEKKSYKIFNNF